MDYVSRYGPLLWLMCHYVALFVNTKRDTWDEVVDTQEKCKAIMVVAAEAKIIMAEARSVMQAAKVEVQHLKEALNKAKNKLASERKKKLAVLAKVAEAKKEMERRVMEVGRLAVEAFKGLKEFSTKRFNSAWRLSSPSKRTHVRKSRPVIQILISPSWMRALLMMISKPLMSWLLRISHNQMKWLKQCTETYLSKPSLLQYLYQLKDLRSRWMRLRALLPPTS
ncbi:hypothetical protein COCNU_14G006590 [Cocos nucifera]|uniref:Uncharacterized protein n=1 Tax=Cocos nucifera TaxID=13894 RepID=A0A8K0IV12_COCNU|nr:hypothetical protein COCNU_14G006590 [Cocos nucifera]